LHGEKLGKEGYRGKRKYQKSQGNLTATETVKKKKKEEGRVGHWGSYERKVKYFLGRARITQRCQLQKGNEAN